MRVLVADVPEMQSRLTEILVGFELRFVSGMSSALKSLEVEQFDLLIVGLHFDESSMFELIEQARARKSTGELPIVCIRGNRLRYGLSLDAFDPALRLLGASECIDLRKYPDTLDGNGSVRRRILACMM